MTSSTAEQVCRRFSVAEIESATEDFGDVHLIGKGGFGSVYKGLVDDGETTVAIKRLSSNSNQGEQEFAAEMETLTQFRHHNLVSLIGYCHEQGEMMLVYEYMENGTLADHLYKASMSSDGGSSLTWNERLKICIGAGRGLDYLHSGCSIIHRDVKSTNILLDKNFIAKVADFGLAKHLGADHFQSYVSASVKGSFGYFDPSYFTTGRLTRASDTYAFGVVLLEVLSGRPAVNKRLVENDLCLTMWAQEKIRNGKVDEIVASNLRGEISDDCLKTFVGVAKRCLHHEPKKRLTMTRAVAQLEVALEQQERKGPKRKVRFPPLNAFWSRVIPSGSTQKHHNKGEVNYIPPEATHAVEEDALEYKHTINMQPNVVVGSISRGELDVITDYFSSERSIINKGCRKSYMFRGVLRSGQDVAVKAFENGWICWLPVQDFRKEVSLISSLEHENVVPLLGYCIDYGGLQALVYEFAPRGSLHDILHGIKSLDLEPVPTLSWAQRLEIAIGAAKGLLYVHGKALIHHNIRSSNVLLFDDEISKITDICLLTVCTCNNLHLSSLHRHEYHPRGAGYSQEDDVYSFGVVLLELLTGHKPFDHTRGRGQQYLVTWATPQLDVDKVQNIVDARLKGDYPPRAAEKMAAVAALCVDDEAEFRPNMSHVIKDLEFTSWLTQNYYLLKKQLAQS